MEAHEPIAEVERQALALAVVKLSGLRPYDRNPRRGDVQAIKESLLENGQYRPIVVNRPPSREPAPAISTRSAPTASSAPTPAIRRRTGACSRASARGSFGRILRTAFHTRERRRRGFGSRTTMVSAFVSF